MDTEIARTVLGHTGIMVSPLCFGTIPLCASRGMAPVRAVGLLRRAFDLGINFLDTAEIYDNYAVIRRAMRGAAPVVVATKSYASDAAGMRRSIDKARRELDLDRIDIFLLHEMESPATLRGHRGALEILLEARARGAIGAAGLSTHTVAGVRTACALADILDVIHPLINRRGIGIGDGTAAEMEAAIASAASLGLGVYAMKVLAGGHLGREAEAAVAYVRALPGVAAVALGIGSEEELLVDLAYCLGCAPPAGASAAVSTARRRLFVEPWCTGCGQCLASCPFGALYLGGGRVCVRADACLLCGYCAVACPHLCLKVV